MQPNHNISVFMKEKKDCLNLAHKIIKSKIYSVQEQYTYYNPIGQDIYNLAIEINNEIITIHDVALFNVFNDIDFYAVVDLVPMWLRNAGHSGESCMSKEVFERLVKLNNNQLTNKFLYYHDLEALINSVQNRFSIITDMIDRLYIYLSPTLVYKFQDYDEVIFTRDFQVHAILNTIIVNTLSCCDILTKLCFELDNIQNISYVNYPKSKSKDILYSQSKKLPEELKKDNTLFSQPTPNVVRQFESLRNEIIHNGTLDFDYSIYYGNKGEDIYTWIFFPDFNECGVLLTYNARRKFYSDASKTFNTILPLMLREFMKLSLNTLTLIKHTYHVDYFESVEDRVKYLKEIHNWYKTYADILKTTSVS